MGEIQWITKGGKHIPLTNEYMNSKIKGKITEARDKNYKNYYTMKYTEGKEELGYLEYQKYKGDIIIDAIRTYPQHQRKGVATKLLKELKRKFGDRVYKFSAVLEDGEKLIKARTEIVKKEDSNYWVKIK